jgi:hypothetical protein
VYSIDRFHDITELEFFLFGGVPETPEPVFERDVQAHSELRRSRGVSPREEYISNQEQVVEHLEVSIADEVLILTPTVALSR